jgi:hypothetical protein
MLNCRTPWSNWRALVLHWRVPLLNCRAILWNWRELKTYTRSLYSQRNITGSQWSSINTGVIWLYFLRRAKVHRIAQQFNKGTPQCNTRALQFDQGVLQFNMFNERAQQFNKKFAQFIGLRRALKFYNGAL